MTTDSNITPICAPRPDNIDWGDELSCAMERERDKLLHVAVLLEADDICYKVDWTFGQPCTHCQRVYDMTRKFRGMALRIRRFWGWAVHPVTDEKLAEMISGNLRILGWRRKGRIPGVLCDPMRDIAVARELERLRVENAELRQRLAAVS